LGGRKKKCAGQGLDWGRNLIDFHREMKKSTFPRRGVGCVRDKGQVSHPGKSWVLPKSLYLDWMTPFERNDLWKLIGRPGIKGNEGFGIIRVWKSNTLKVIASSRFGWRGLRKRKIPRSGTREEILDADTDWVRGGLRTSATPPLAFHVQKPSETPRKSGIL